MSLLPPPYFHTIQRRARERWDQLEADPELAGPWRLLFQQVQSPRHVVSELLQNADDAGAKNVRIAIEQDTFIFEHDGRDFSEAEFASLCRFGFSNKRSLHTIGFRGIGFKSTFSLGLEVEVRSPTVAIRFHSKRFTEPLWIDGAEPSRLTQVRVPILSTERLTELQRSLEDWQESCASLLFFRKLETVDIEGEVIGRVPLGTGPVANSRWMRLTSRPDDRLLVVRSELADFPEDAVEEIRQERNANDITLPPCQVDLVLGLHGDEQFFVVLPTGVRPPLPFSCNAPFLQDPSRHGIKPPSLSPTNRWLLGRLGQLAARSMTAWLANSSLSMEERADAYRLLPPASAPHEPTGENLVAELVTRSFAAGLEGKPCVLTATGAIAKPKRAMSLPRALQAAWSNEDLSAIFSSTNEVVVAAEVADGARHRLASWKLARAIGIEEIVNFFLTSIIPRPKSSEALASLWALLEPECRYRRKADVRRKLRIVPVAGSTHLHSAERVVRLAGRATLPTPEAWEFLSKLVNVIDGDWISYLLEKQDELRPDEVKSAAASMLQLIELDSPTSITRVISEAGRRLFGKDEFSLADGVHLAHIAAAMDADVSEAFYYATLDGDFREVDHGIVADSEAVIEMLVPNEWAQDHILHGDYFAASKTCRPDKWLSWVRSVKSGLLAFPPLRERERKLWGMSQLESFLHGRNVAAPESFHYRSKNTRIDDFDFDDDLVLLWQQEEESNPTVWSKVIDLILLAPSELWSDSLLATVYEVSGVYERRAACEQFAAAWVERLSRKKCLADTYGNIHEPAHLLMRSPDTEPLMGVELFVKAELDTEQTKPLLRLLGVRDTPSGPFQLINRIRALSTVTKPPIHEVVRWYDALDRVLARASSADLAQAKYTCQLEPLILTQELDWVTSAEVFLAEDEQNVPGAATVHEAVRHFAMWSRLGVEERPTVERVLAWLKTIESGSTLESGEIKRVRTVLARFPQQVWEQCQHWLSLDGTWVPVSDLKFRLSMQGLTRYSDLFPAFKLKVADLRTLDAATCEQLPFSTLQALDRAIEYRVTDRQSGGRPAEAKPWLTAMGAMLQRVTLEDESATERVRLLGARLCQTTWQSVHALKVSPYIEGTPAGQPASADALWHDTTLYVQDRSFSRLFNALVHELARPFGSALITEAIRACMGRDDEFIADYFAENFTLSEPPAALPAEPSLLDDAASLAGAASQATPTTSSGSEPPSSVNEADSSFDVEGPFEDGVTTHDDFSINADSGTSQSSPAPPRSRAPTLFERFVAAEGFHYDHRSGKYVHPEGDWLVRRPSGFNCERLSASGELVCQYWISDQNLWNGGVEINAELWEMLKIQCHQSAVVLTGVAGEPVVLHAAELLRRVAANEILLFPAKYRLRHVD